MKTNILKNHFKHYKYANLDDLAEGNVYFFDTENAPLFPQDLVDKYDLINIEYDKLDVFQDVSKQGLLYKLLKERKMTTSIYIWMFGSENSDDVYWGNSIDEFIELMELINEHKIKNGVKVDDFTVYVHNLQYDIEFFKYWFKDKHFKQLKVSQDRKERKASEKLENSFDITETNGTVHGARIQLEKRSFKVGRKKVNYLTTICFKDSFKITPTSLKNISEKLIKVDDIYIKNSEVYKYNTVRDPKTYIPDDVEGWYQYCDIYLLKEWYNQFVYPMYIKEGVTPFTISQIAFESILKESYKFADRTGFRKPSDKVTDRDLYEDHYSLRYIEKATLYKEYFKRSYKGGHTTASTYFKELAKNNDATISGVSIDITSSYPNQMTHKKLPFGKPYYFEGKYEDQIIDDKKYDYHFITIGFDGWTPKNEGCKFGLNVKIRGLTDEQKQQLKLTTNESAVSNWLDGEFVGFNDADKRLVENKRRMKVLKKYDNRFIVTIPANEFEQWDLDYNFYSYKNGVLQKGVMFIDYVCMQSEVGYFAKGLDKFFKMKENADLNGNVPVKENAKTIINSFYGKHASNRDREQRFYNFDNEIISFHSSDQEEYLNEWEDDKLYAQYYASAVTSEGRIQLRKGCRAIGNEHFIYADTDSLKFNISKDDLIKRVQDHNSKASPEDKLNISFSKEDKHLGWWDFEFEFDDFKAVGQKKYVYLKKGKTDFTCKCAGLPKEIRNKIITKDQFSVGTEFVKKAKRKVIGGYLIVDISYSLNDLLVI